jgi:hypothetical protein
MTRKLLFTFFICLSLISASIAQIPNNGFNSWTNYNPNNWVTANVTMFMGNDTSAFPITSGPDLKEGSTTLKLTTIKLATNPFAPNLPDTVGVLFTGSINFFSGSLITGFPYTGRPNDMSFLCKYNPVGTDTAWASVMLQKWNNMTNMRDTIAIGTWGVYGNMASSWSAQTVPLVYNPTLSSVFPDTAVIVFSSSSYFRPKIGSALYLDAVGFNGWNGIDEISKADGAYVYPNPAENEVTFAVAMEEAAYVQVFDITGRKTDMAVVKNRKANIAVTSYTAGIYLYNILDEKGTVLTHGKLSITH